MSFWGCVKGSLVTVAHSPRPTWEPVVGAGDLPADHDNSHPARTGGSRKKDI